MSTKPKTIDLEHAVPGQIFRLRDGNPIKYVTKLAEGVRGTACYQFTFGGTDQRQLPITCFRTRDGRLSSISTERTDGRDIVDRVYPDLEQYDLGQHFRLRNGTLAWMQQISANREATYRWTIGERPYMRNGTHLISGNESPYDIVAVVDLEDKESKEMPDETPTEEPGAKIDLSVLPLGTEFRRRDGQVVMFVSNSETQKSWPYRVGKETYTADGCYMSTKSQNTKDLVEVILRTKKTPLTRAEAFFALRELTKPLSASMRQKFDNLINFVEAS